MRTPSWRGRRGAEQPEGPPPYSGIPAAAGTRGGARAGRGAEAGREASVGRRNGFLRPPVADGDDPGGGWERNRPAGAGGLPPAPRESSSPVERGGGLGFVFARLLGAASGGFLARAGRCGDGTVPVPVNAVELTVHQPLDFVELPFVDGFFGDTRG